MSRLPLLATALLLVTLPLAAQEELLKNPSFETIGPKGVPAEWGQYAGGTPESQLKIETPGRTGKNAVRLIDTGPNVRDNRYAIGVQQDVPVKPGQYYLASVWAKCLASNNANAVLLQLTFPNAGKSFSRQIIAPVGSDWQRFKIGAQAPEGATSVRFYLYTMHFWTSDTILDDASLVTVPTTGLSSVVLQAGEDEIPVVRPLKLQTVLTVEGKPAAVLASPTDPAWQQVALDLQALIQRKTGATVPIVTDAKALLDSDQTILALGNLNNNFILERLYFNQYTRADSLWPGKGEYALRTVHQPFNFRDLNVLTVEASDVEGAKRAVADLAARLPEGPNCALDRPLLMVSSAKPLSEEAAKAVLDAPLGPDLWVQFWQAARSWRDSGEIAQAQRARQALFACRDRLLENPAYHINWPEETTSNNLGAMWDVIEEAPVFTDAERLEFTNVLYVTLANLRSNVYNWGTFADNQTLVWNHQTFPLLGVYWLARYFERYYPGQTTLYRDCLAQVEGAFRGAVKSWKPQCDADGYLTITPRHTIEYTLSRNDYSYFETGQVRQLAEYLTGMCDNVGDIPGFGDSGYGKGPGYELNALPIAYWYYQDPRYLWRLQQLYDNKWANPYRTDITPVVWKEIVGLTVWPMAPEYYRWANTTPSYGGEPEPLKVPYERAFDKITFRESLERECPFLLLDGFGRGKHLHYDTNNLIKYHADGQDWLIDGDYLVRNTTEHNMISVIRDGRADQLVPPAASLDAQADLDTCAFVRSTVANYNGADWSRNVLWLKGVGFLLVDELKAVKEGDFRFENVFKHLDLGVQALTDGRIFTTLRPMAGGAGSRDLQVVSNPAPDVAKAVKFTEQVSRLEFPLNLKAGQYGITLFAQGKDTGSDSLFLCIDGGEDIAFHIPVDKLGPSSSTWTKDTPTPNVTIAEDGQHVVRITLRENPGVLLSRVLVQDAQGREVADIDATNPPLLDPLQARTAPDARFFVKNDGQATCEVTTRVNNVNLRLKYLRETFGGRLREKDVVSSQNLFYNDRSDKALNLDLRRVSTTDTLVLRDGKPWGRLSVSPDRNLAGLPGVLVAWTTTDRLALLDVSSGLLTATAPVSLEIDLKTGAAALYAAAETEITVDGRKQAVAKGRSSLDLSKWSRLAALRAEAARAVEEATKPALAPRPATGASFDYPSLAKDWTLPVARQDDQVAVINRLVPADLQGGGAEELLVGWGRYAVCLDSAGKQLWSLETGARVNDFATGDLNGDGKPEVLIGSDDEHFYITDAAGKLLSKTHCDAALRVGTSSVRDPRVSNVAIGDLEGDGQPDVIIGTRNGNLLRYNAKLEKQWAFNRIEHGTYRMRLIDLDKDGALEIVAGNRYGSVEVVTARGLEAPGTYSELGDVVFGVGDLDGDGKYEIVNGSSTGALTCTRWRDKVLWSFNNYGYGVTDLRIADYDKDGKLETAVASETGYVYLLGPDGTARATRQLSSAVLSLAVVGSGSQTRLAAGCRDGRVFILDGKLQPVLSAQTSGPVTWLSALNRADGKQSLIVAGGEELLCLQP
jgi:hypothetical protein